MTKAVDLGFDPAAVRRALDRYGWEHDEPGRESRRIFLGSVFALLPSGKYYTPWASSNLAACPACGGKGLRVHGVKTPIRGRSGPYCVVEVKACGRCAGLGSAEARDDERWREAAGAALDGVGCFLEEGEGDPCDLFAVEVRDVG